MIGITGQQFLDNSMGWDADKLAILFMSAYERPSYDPNINHYALRQTLANIWYNYIINRPPTPTPSKKNTNKWLYCRAKNIRIKI